MASNWNRGLKFSIFGESYGEAVGVVVDNVPPGFEVDLERIKIFMKRRTQGNFEFGCGLRREPDEFKVLSGIFNGRTTGAPICVIVLNKRGNFKVYEEFKNIIRPGHADYGALKRYGGFNDYRGSGHLSGRLTAPLVFVGGLCEQILEKKGVKSFAHIGSIGKVFDSSFLNNEENFNLVDLEKIKSREIAVLNERAVSAMKNEIESCSSSGNSIGGTIECAIFGVDAGVGSPIFDKIENYLADLVFAIPAVKALEFGLGFEVAKFKGSENNDEFFIENGVVKTKTNNCGGVLGGISTGMPIVFKVAVKPTPTIFKKQKTVDLQKNEQKVVQFKGQHDSCIVLRAVVVVESVANIAIVSQYLNQGLL